MPYVGGVDSVLLAGISPQMLIFEACLAMTQDFSQEFYLTCFNTFASVPQLSGAAR